MKRPHTVSSKLVREYANRQTPPQGRFDALAWFPGANPNEIIACSLPSCEKVLHLRDSFTYPVPLPRADELGDLCLKTHPLLLFCCLEHLFASAFSPEAYFDSDDEPHYTCH